MEIWTFVCFLWVNRPHEKTKTSNELILLTTSLCVSLFLCYIKLHCCPETIKNTAESLTVALCDMFLHLYEHVYYSLHTLVWYHNTHSWFSNVWHQTTVPRYRKSLRLLKNKLDCLYVSMCNIATKHTLPSSCSKPLCTIHFQSSNRHPNKTQFLSQIYDSKKLTHRAELIFRFPALS